MDEFEVDEKRMDEVVKFLQVNEVYHPFYVFENKNTGTRHLNILSSDMTSIMKFNDDETVSISVSYIKKDEINGVTDTLKDDSGQAVIDYIKSIRNYIDTEVVYH